ncbi:hypothetical protein [Nonomuraea pusilla]|uniref:Uncharacterized protein n=1 Tax=Nonomuraea pusilla TaxID=46177 RepID=A0A1H7V8B1_9ACTN|nr:hypothetical protein [Nonomuraea pusilla]SEM05178.1 hypothetical protein SAMN05660976_04026 [Nonomuraea pusilla]
MSEAVTHQPTMNPLGWNWNPGTWGWGFDLGNVLNPMPLLHTIQAMYRAIPSLFGSDETEGRLRSAAEAHLRLERDLDRIYDALDAQGQGHTDGYLNKVVKEWKGSAGDEFRRVWRTIVDQETRYAAKKSCKGVAEVLTAVADSAHMTKKALFELLRTALIWVGIFFALRAFAFVWTTYVAQMMAYVKATRIVAMAVQLIAKVQSLFKMFAGIMRALPLIGKLRVPAGLASMATRLAGALRTGLAKSFDPAVWESYFAKKTFGAYAKTSAYTFGGVLATHGLAQGMKGESIFNFDPASISQAARITTAATFIGTHAPVGGPFTKGLFQGGGAATWAASLTKSGAAVGEGGMSFAAFVATRNWANKFWAKPAWMGADLHKQLWGLPFTSVFRVWRPLHTTDQDMELPSWQRPQPGQAG